MTTWQVLSVVAALPFVGMILFSPPRSRAAYLVYSTIFAVLATSLMYAVFSADLAIRASLGTRDGIKDLAVSNSSQFAIVVIGMLLGGLSTNLLVAGLSFPWVDRSIQVREERLLQRHAEQFFQWLLRAVEESIRIIPGSARYEYIKRIKEDPIIFRRLRELGSEEREHEVIAKLNELQTRRDGPRM